MTDIAQDLEKIILKAGIEGALTEEAVAQFHALVKERDAIKIELTDLKKVHENTVINRDALNERCQAAEKCAEEWAGREQDLMDREGKCDHLEMEAKYQGLRVEDHKTMFTTVFRNSVLREQVMTPLPGLKADQYGTSHAPYAQKDDVESEET